MIFVPRVNGWRSPPPGGSLGASGSLPAPNWLYFPPQPAVDFVRKEPATVTVSNAPSFAKTYHGWAASAGGVNGGYYWLANRLRPSTNYTVFAVVRDTSGRGAFRNPVDGDPGASIAPNGRWFQLRFNTSNQAEFIAFNTSGSTFTSTGSIASSDTDISVLVGRVRGTEVSSWLNGVKSTPATLTGTPRVSTATSARIGVCLRPQSGTPSGAFNGEVYLAGYFAEALSDAQIVDLSLDPWILFAPRRRHFLLVPGAGGGGGTITADAGSYTLTGSAVGLLHDRLTSAEGGSYTVTGTAADLLRDRLLPAGAGSYTLTGQDVALLRDRLLTLGAGAYAVTGQDVTLAVQNADTLTAEPGAYTLTGSSVGLLHDRVISLGSGSYAVTGQDVTLEQLGSAIQLEAGTFTLTGQDVALLRQRVLEAAAGAFALTGSAVSLSTSTAIVTLPGDRVLIVEPDGRYFIVPAESRLFKVH